MELLELFNVDVAHAKPVSCINGKETCFAVDRVRTRDFSLRKNTVTHPACCASLSQHSVGYCRLTYRIVASSSLINRGTFISFPIIRCGSAACFVGRPWQATSFPRAPPPLVINEEFAAKRRVDCEDLKTTIIIIVLSIAWSSKHTVDRTKASGMHWPQYLVILNNTPEYELGEKKTDT